MGRLEGKTAIVTGGASGFGEEIVRTYVREGARVAILDLNGDGASAVARDIGNAASAFTCDVANGANVSDACAEVIKAFGEVDILVNTLAGPIKPTPPGNHRRRFRPRLRHQR